MWLLRGGLDTSLAALLCIRCRCATWAAGIPARRALQ